MFLELLYRNYETLNDSRTIEITSMSWDILQKMSENESKSSTLLDRNLDERIVRKIEKIL